MYCGGVGLGMGLVVPLGSVGHNRPQAMSIGRSCASVNVTHRLRRVRRDGLTRGESGASTMWSAATVGSGLGGVRRNRGLAAATTLCTYARDCIRRRVALWRREKIWRKDETAQRRSRNSTHVTARRRPAMWTHALPRCHASARAPTVSCRSAGVSACFRVDTSWRHHVPVRGHAVASIVPSPWSCFGIAPESTLRNRRLSLSPGACAPCTAQAEAPAG